MSVKSHESGITYICILYKNTHSKLQVLFKLMVQNKEKLFFWWTNEFIGVTHKNMDDGLLIGTGIIQRQLYHWKSTFTWVMTNEH